jgi:uncharacterized membrane protein YczE
MGVLVVIVVLVAIAVLAPIAGADSRGLTDRAGGPPDLLPPDRTMPPDGTSLAHRLPSLGSRLCQLYAGLVLYGVSMAFFVQARLGVMPWDVLHQGLTRWLPLTLGQVTILVSVVVLLGWIPLRQRPGFGTISNIVVIGLVVDAALGVLPAPEALGRRAAFLVAGVVLNAVATAAYIGARMGPGPRDGLMTGFVARTGQPVRRIRTLIEVAVVAAGWLLGGNFGAGTLLYALAIGPLVQPLLPLLDSDRRSGGRAAHLEVIEDHSLMGLPVPVRRPGGGACQSLQ